MVRPYHSCHRALAIEDGDGLAWIRIGSHAGYNRLIG